MESWTHKKILELIPAVLIVCSLIGIIILTIIKYSDIYIWLIFSIAALFAGILLIFIIHFNKKYQAEAGDRGSPAFENFHVQKLFELAVYVKTIVIIIPIVGLLLTFLGYTTKKDIEEQLLSKINAKAKLETLDLYIEKGGKLIESMQKYENKFLPVGSIVAYDGKLPLPEGWAICNGDPITFYYPNGDSARSATPNLIGKFIRGVGDTTEAGRELGDEKHTHQFAMPAFSTEANVSESGMKDKYCFDYHISSGKPGETIYLAQHKHQLKFPKSMPTDSTISLPPYYTLIYIIRYK